MLAESEPFYEEVQSNKKGLCKAIKISRLLALFTKAGN